MISRNLRSCLLLSTALLTIPVGPVLAQTVAGGDPGIDCEQPRFNSDGKLVFDPNLDLTRSMCETDRATALNWASLVTTTATRLRNALAGLPPPVLGDFVTHLENSDTLADWRADPGDLANLRGHDRERQAQYWAGGILAEDTIPAEWRGHMFARACGSQGRGMVLVWLDPDMVRDRWTPAMVQRTVRTWIEAQEGRGQAIDRVPAIVTGAPGHPALTRYDGHEWVLDPACYDHVPRDALAMRIGLHWDTDTERKNQPCTNPALVGYQRMERRRENGIFVGRDGNGDYRPLTDSRGRFITDPEDAWTLYSDRCRPPGDLEVIRTADCPGTLNGKAVTGKIVRTYLFAEFRDGSDPMKTVMRPAKPDGTPVKPGKVHPPVEEKVLFCTGPLPPGDVPEIPNPEPNDPAVTNWRVEDCATAHDGDFNEGTRTGWMQRIDYPDDWPVEDEIIVLSLDDRCFRPVRKPGTQSRNRSCPANHTGSITEERRLEWWNRDWADRRHDQADGDRTVAQAATDYDADPGQAGLPWYDVVAQIQGWTTSSNTCRPRQTSGSEGGGGEGGGGGSFDVDFDGHGDFGSEQDAQDAGFGIGNDVSGGCGSCNGPEGHDPGQNSSDGDKGGGSGGSGGGGCFLTTAIVDRRGEADDGPTLTALRHFRDTWMTDHPDGARLIREYYAQAPRIVAAIPDDHSDWDWIGAQVDRAVRQIEGGDPQGAFDTYCTMVKRLMDDWLPADRVRDRHAERAAEGKPEAAL